MESPLLTPMRMASYKKVKSVKVKPYILLGKVIRIKWTSNTY